MILLLGGFSFVSGGFAPLERQKCRWNWIPQGAAVRAKKGNNSSYIISFMQPLISSRIHVIVKSWQQPSLHTEKKLEEVTKIGSACLKRTHSNEWHGNLGTTPAVRWETSVAKPPQWLKRKQAIKCSSNAVFLTSNLFAKVSLHPNKLTQRIDLSVKYI